MQHDLYRQLCRDMRRCNKNQRFLFVSFKSIFQSQIGTQLLFLQKGPPHLHHRLDGSLLGVIRMCLFDWTLRSSWSDICFQGYLEQPYSPNGGFH